MDVLFVCTGNTCRSSMAEGIAKDYLTKKRLTNIEVIISAGVAAFPGSPASLNAIEAMREQNIDISAHGASQIDRGMVGKADIILAMTNGHKASILRNFPEAKAKTFTLKEYVLGEHGDIYDPYGGDLEIYRSCAEELFKLIPLALDKISQA